MSACVYAAQQLRSRHVSARHTSCIQHTVTCYRLCSWAQTYLTPMYMRYLWSITCSSGSRGVEKIEMFAVRVYHPKVKYECPTPG
jgi:hypothetical protein